MALPTPLQTVTQAFNSVTSVTVTMPNPTRAQGGLGIGPSVFVAILSYDGNATDQVNGYTDSDSETWAQANDGTTAATVSNGAGVNAEGWVCRSGGYATTKTVTFTFSSTRSGVIAITETPQVRSAGTFVDRVRANINTTASTSRIGSNFVSKKVGMHDVCISGLGFNHATMTCSGVPASWGNYTGLKDGTSNVGVGVAYSAGTGTAEPNLSAGSGIARYNMSATTTPVALIAIAMFRDGIATAGTEDAWIDNIEGATTVYASDGEHFIFSSSTSAPFGGTGSSETSRSLAKFPAIDPYIKSGATYGSTLKEWCNVDGPAGGDDGTGYMQLYGYFNNTDKYHTPVDGTDWDISGGVLYALLYAPTVGGFQSVTLQVSDVHNASGPSWSSYTMAGDTGGLQSGSWFYITEWSGNVPRFREFDITYPSLFTAKPKTFVSIFG